jgi:formyltetrahydrofolate-dependent phosphoribosylglycinamide formyltransferase
MNPSTAGHQARVVILGSGAGSNARTIIAYAREHADCPYTVAAVVTTSPTAGIVRVAEEAGVHVSVLDRGMSADEQRDALIDLIDRLGIDVVALAGYMRFLHPDVIAHVKGMVVNVHPSLLPAHGGHGMYGMHVHRSVLAAGDRESGATVHWVNDVYDGGAIIGQERVPVLADDTPESLSERVRAAEHRLYPRILREVCTRVPGHPEGMP